MFNASSIGLITSPFVLKEFQLDNFLINKLFTGAKVLRKHLVNAKEAIKRGNDDEVLKYFRQALLEYQTPFKKRPDYSLEDLIDRTITTVPLMEGAPLQGIGELIGLKALMITVPSVIDTLEIKKALILYKALRVDGINKTFKQFNSQIERTIFEILGIGNSGEETKKKIVSIALALGERINNGTHEDTYLLNNPYLILLLAAHFEKEYEEMGNPLEISFFRNNGSLYQTLRGIARMYKGKTIEQIAAEIKQKTESMQGTAVQEVSIDRNTGNAARVRIELNNRTLLPINVEDGGNKILSPDTSISQPSTVNKILGEKVIEEAVLNSQPDKNSKVNPVDQDISTIDEVITFDLSQLPPIDKNAISGILEKVGPSYLTNIYNYQLVCDFKNYIEESVADEWLKIIKDPALEINYLKLFATVYSYWQITFTINSKGNGNHTNGGKLEVIDLIRLQSVVNSTLNDAKKGCEVSKEEIVEILQTLNDKRIGGAEVPVFMTDLNSGKLNNTDRHIFDSYELVINTLLRKNKTLFTYETFIDLVLEDSLKKTDLSRIELEVRLCNKLSLQPDDAYLIYAYRELRGQSGKEVNIDKLKSKLKVEYLDLLLSTEPKDIEDRIAFLTERYPGLLGIDSPHNVIINGNGTRKE